MEGHEKRPSSKPWVKSKLTTTACFNSDEEGHYVDKCPLLIWEKRVHLRATHTVAEEADDDGDEDVSGDSQNGSEESEAEDLNRKHVIEVAASEFYDNVALDPEFLTSLHAFPIWDQTAAPKVELTPAMVEKGSKEPGPQPNRKYQLHHSGTTRMRPQASQEEKECLVAWVRVGNLATWALWDSGSTLTGVTPAFTEIVKLRLDMLEDPHVLQLGTVGSRSIIKYRADVQVEVGKTNIMAYVDIANFDCYDMVIGTPWMRRNKVKLDFENDQIMVNGITIPAIKVNKKDLDPRVQRHRVTDKHKTE